MDIPGDYGHPFRLNKFVEYQHAVPPIHPVTLLAYIERNKLSPDAIMELAVLISATYCEVTTLFLFEKEDWTTITPARLHKFWTQHKPNLIFNSARKYAKNMDWFPRIIERFQVLLGPRPFEWLQHTAAGQNGLENYDRVLKEVLTVDFTGRFAADLFLEMLLWATRRNLWDVRLSEPDNLDWKRGSNLTSGLLNVFYADAAADEFDNSGRISVDADQLMRWLRTIQVAVRRCYPQQECSLPLIQTKLCSFRNLFKGTRYGGYHHDRQLANLIQMEAAYPAHPVWSVISEIRLKKFPRWLLGEYGGWTGIRKERCKLWLREGKTGVEEGV